MKVVKIGKWEFSVKAFGSNAHLLRSENEAVPYPIIAQKMQEQVTIHDYSATDSEIVIYGVEPTWEDLSDLDVESEAGRKLALPVCFELGTDWKEFLNKTKLGKGFAKELIMRAEYKLSFVGFMPGFLYLNGLDKRLRCARKAKPGLNMEMGSIAVGGNYLGCYPSKCVGGWYELGRTPVACHNIASLPPLFVDLNDAIEIQSISMKDYNAIKNSELNLLEYNGLQT